MHDGIRRSIICLIVFLLSGVVLFAWTRKDGRFDLFDLLTGKRIQQTKVENIELREEPVLAESEVPGLARLNQDFKLLAARVTPAVISITTGRRVNQRIVRRTGFGTEVINNPYWEEGIGSGVIITADGYVVTNYHVIKGTEKIGVNLADSDEFLPVRLVGHSVHLDIAVLKIEDDSRKFEHLSLIDDSDEVEKGELVFAVGNPFGDFRGTVTQGIVSGKDRRSDDSSAEMIQTNAIINRGNSGGPLVNIRGEIIGINTAIYSGDQPTGIWQGIGLAIAANDVRDVIDHLIHKGRPMRGFLGVSYATAPSSSDRDAVQILAVDPGSPAKAAGLQPGDIVVELDGHKVRGIDDFSKRLRRLKVGETASLDIMRDGAKRNCEAVIAELDEAKLAAARRDAEGSGAKEIASMLASVGIEASDIPGGYGVLVDKVAEDAPWKKIQEGDRIVKFDGFRTPEVRTLAFLMSKAEPEEKIQLDIVRDFGRNRLAKGAIEVTIPALEEEP